MATFIPAATSGTVTIERVNATSIAIRVGDYAGATYVSLDEARGICKALQSLIYSDFVPSDAEHAAELAEVDDTRESTEDANV